MITRTNRSLLAGIATAIGCVGVGLLFGSGGGATALLGIALVGMVTGVTVTLASPIVIYLILAFVLGGLPFSVVPGVGPAILVLAMGVWAAMLTHPIHRSRTSAIEVAVIFSLLVSLASVIVSAVTMVHVSEFIKWALAASVVVPLMRLSRPDLRKVGIAYAVGATVGGGFSFFLFLFDKSGTLINVLAPIGYGVAGEIGTTLRFFEVGDTAIVRLTGTYVDPNAAGIFLFIGLALAIALMRGWVRLIASAVIGVALLVSLSRSALASVVVAVLLYLMFQKLSTTARFAIVLGGVVAVVGALSVPAVNARILNSFGSGDTGTDQRSAALSNFIPSMEGHWWFGRGWGAKEFIDEVANFQTNFVANAPLVVLYRGGVACFVAFVLILIAGIVTAHRHCRSLPWESGVIGAAFVGFTVVALQLDFPVATNAAAGMAFSIFLVMLSENPITRTTDEPLTSGEHRAERLST